MVLDSETVLDGLPEEAWAYRLGNRSGVEWVLDQHKEKTPRDPTIREKFNSYRFIQTTASREGGLRDSSCLRDGGWMDRTCRFG